MTKGVLSNKKLCFAAWKGRSDRAWKGRSDRAGCSISSSGCISSIFIFACFSAVGGSAFKFTSDFCRMYRSALELE